MSDLYVIMRRDLSSILHIDDEPMIFKYELDAARVAVGFDGIVKTLKDASEILKSKAEGEGE